MKKGKLKMKAVSEGSSSGLATRDVNQGNIENNATQAEVEVNDIYAPSQSLNELMNSLKGVPLPQNLFSKLIHENELSILVSRTNLGKSILALQIGNAVASGTPLDFSKPDGEPQHGTITPIKTLYVDLEMSNIQFAARFSDPKNGEQFKFSENLYRWNPSLELSEDDIIKGIRYKVVDQGIGFVIIDPITQLTGKSFSKCVQFMIQLKEMKKELGITILALAHTSSKKPKTDPITIVDLFGSSAVSMYSDSIFAMNGSTEDPAMRYIIGLKTRVTENPFDAEHVLVMDLVKTGADLHFRYRGTDHEMNHAIYPKKQQELAGYDEETLKEIGKLLDLGKTQREISQITGHSLGKINKYAKIHKGGCRK